MNRMVSFIGAGPGAVDLITVRGQKLLSEADVIIYAGSLVNKGLLNLKKKKNFSKKKKKNPNKRKIFLHFFFLPRPNIFLPRRN